MKLIACMAAATISIKCEVAFAQVDETLSDEFILEEIVVTATKRTANLQSVKASVGVLTGNNLKDSGYTGLEDYAKAIPSLDIVDANPIQQRVTIRGVSNTVGPALVGFYVDEIPLTSSQFDQPALRALDLERLEVLRGPQGTLYGEGSIGGTIRYVTNKPDTTDFSGSVSATYSDMAQSADEGLKLSGVINLPLVEDKLAVRVVAFKNDNSGYIDNAGLDLKDVNSSDAFGGRVAVRWKPTDSITIDASAHLNHIEIDGGSASAPGTYIQDGSSFFSEGLLSVREDEFEAYNLTANIDLGWADFLSASTWTDRETSASGGLSPDLADFIIGTINFGFGGSATDAARFSNSESANFSQEIRLSSKGESNLVWILGGFYQKLESSQIVKFNALPDSTPLLEMFFGPGAELFGNKFEDETKRVALFGSLTYHLSDQLSVEAGLRWFDEDVKMTSSIWGLVIGGPFTEPALPPLDSSGDKGVIPRIAMSYDLSDDSMIYASASKGFRSSSPYTQSQFAVDVDGILDGLTGVPAETLWSYEFGVKSMLLEDKLRINASVYHVDWANYRTLVLLNAGTGDVAQRDVGDASILGFEVEVTALITDHFQLTFSGNVADAETNSATMDTNPITGANVSLPAGQKLPTTPEYKMSAMAKYNIPLNDSLDLDLIGTIYSTGEQFSTVMNLDEGHLDAYTTFSLRAKLRSESWDISLFCNNCGNKYAAGSANLYALDGSVGDVYTIRPRTIGIQLDARF